MKCVKCGNEISFNKVTVDNEEEGGVIVIGKQCLQCGNIIFDEDKIKGR